MTLEDMEKMSSKIMNMDFGPDVNMSRAHIVDGKLLTVKNLIQYKTTVISGQETCVVVTVVDGLTGKTISTQRKCHVTGKGQIDETEQLIMNWITACDRIHRHDNDDISFKATLKILNMALQQYRTAGNILVFDKNIFKFNIFSDYGKIIRQLLEVMRKSYDRDNQGYYVDNIEFIISIRQVVEMLKKPRQSPDEYISVKRIIKRIMDAYYKNQPLDKFKDDLKNLSNDRIKIIILPLIQIVTDPPPTDDVKTPSEPDAVNDGFESELRQLINDLEGIGRANHHHEVEMIQFFNSVLKEYLENLYVLPKFKLPAKFKFDFSSELYAEIFNKFLLILQQQYNQQHDTTETEKCFRLIQITELLLKFSKLLKDKSKDDYKIVANITVNIVWGDKPGIKPEKLDQLTRILELLVKLARQRRKTPDDGGKELFVLILKIMKSLRESEGSSEDLVDVDIPGIDNYEDLIAELRRIVDELKSKNPPKVEDEFIVKIKNIILHLKELHRDVCKPDCPSDGYEKLLEILNTILKDYRKNKMLRIYTIEELRLYIVYPEYADIFFQIIKALEYQYIKQKQHNEVTKLIWILQIQKMLIDVEKDIKKNAEIQNIKEILIKMMKDIYDRKRLEENYIAALMKLKGENELTKLIIRLITMINNMPRQILPPTTDEDYFEKEIRLLITLLTKIHEEGKPDKGFKDTMFLLQFVLMKYQIDKKLPGFQLDELKLFLVHPEYQEVVDKLIQLLQKKYVEQRQNDELMKLIYVSKIREWLIKLNILSEGDDASGKSHKQIKNVLIRIMVDLYTNGKLMKDYEKILEEYKEQFPRYEDLIIEIIKYLKTCPKDKSVDSRKEDKGSAVTIILEILDDLKKMKDRSDKNYPELVAMLKKIIEAIKENNNRLPSVKELQLRLDIYLWSGLYDEILTKLIDDLLSRYSVEKKLKEVSILVKIEFLLDYIEQLRKIHVNMGSDVGYKALLESLIIMINDLCENGEFTKDYMKDWGPFLKQQVEYKSIILLVIELLRQGCAPCDFTPATTTTTTTTPSPADSGEVSVDTDSFEKLIREVRELVYLLRHEKEQSESGYATLDKWLEMIEKLYYANNRTLPPSGIIQINLYDTITGYDQAINKLIEYLTRQFNIQNDLEVAKKLKFVLEIRAYLIKINEINDDRERQQIIDLLINIMRHLWHGKKLKEDSINQLERFKINNVVIVNLIVYLRQLPAVYWVVPIGRDDFEEEMRRYLLKLKEVYDRGGSYVIYQGQMKGIKMLLKIYIEHNKTLPTGLRPTFNNMFEVTMQYSEIWRQMIQALIAQYRRQNQMGEIRRYEFILQMQLFLRQIIFVGPQVNPNTFREIISLMLQIFSDFHEGVLRQNYMMLLLQYLRYNALRPIVPNVVYYLSNFDEQFMWIHGEPKQQYVLKMLRHQLTIQYTSKIIIRQVYTVWNGNVASGPCMNNYCCWS